MAPLSEPFPTSQLCPQCHSPLPEPKPPLCPNCGVSLQSRFQRLTTISGIGAALLFTASMCLAVVFGGVFIYALLTLNEGRKWIDPVLRVSLYGAVVCFVASIGLFVCFIVGSILKAKTKH
ncbi:hypothetical protein IAD21_04292 [Abditibacteriota bacterium]|nr:hypothetical protein IAD21_04292 [Abditibacteriota bacterium]